MWKDCNVNSLNLRVMHISSSFIVCSIQLLNIVYTFVLIFIYAPVQSSHKDEFWEEIINYINSLSMHFIMSGDSNELNSDL